jgi:hypothetical protein
MSNNNISTEGYFKTGNYNEYLNKVYKKIHFTAIVVEKCGRIC